MRDAGDEVLDAVLAEIAPMAQVVRVGVVAQLLGGMARVLVEEIGREKASRLLYRLADTVTTDQRVGR